MAVGSDKSGINIIVRKFPGVINMPLQIRRGTEAERLAMTVPLAAGELLYITDDQRLYVGNGTLAGGVPITGYTNDDAQDAAAALFSSGTHRSISFTYNDSLNKIDAVVSLENYNGTVRGDLIGSVFADDSTLGGIPLIDGTNGTFNLDGTVKGNIVPDANLLYDIGSSSNRFKDLYLSGSTIYLGSATITASGSAVNLPAGSLVGGVPIGSGSGDGVIPGSNYNINIVGDDSTVIVNSSTKVVTAAGGFVGNITGNSNGVHTGNVSGNVTGNVTGNINGIVTGTAGSSLVGNVTGNLLNSLGSTIVNTSTRTATLSQLNIESAGSISSPSMLVNSPAVTFLTNTVNPAAPFVNFFIADSTGTATSAVGLVRSRGTLIAPAAVTANDEIGSIVSSAFDGTSFILATNITSVVDGTVSTGVVPSKIDFSATNSAGATSVKMSIKGSAVEFIAPPKLPVIANDTARTTAVPTPTKGMMIMMESGTTPAATNVVQVYDGSAWVNLY